jgi:hypothetical protein
MERWRATLESYVGELRWRATLDDKVVLIDNIVGDGIRK